MDDNYYQSKKFQQLLNMYENARQNGQSPYMEADDLADIADYYQIHGRKSQAIGAARYALQLFPDAVQPLTFLARMAILVDNDEKAAWNYLDQVGDKSDLDYIYTVAEVKLAKNKIQEAEAYLEEKFQEVDEQEDFILDVALLLCDYNQFDLAQHWLDRSTDYDEPDYKEVKGRILMDKGNLDESAKIFNQLIDDNPYSSTYWNYLATVQYLQNDADNAIESSEFALAINPDDINAKINKANGFYLLGNFNEALRGYKEVLSKDPNNTAVIFNIALSLINLNRLQEAISYLEPLREHESKGSDSLWPIDYQLTFIYANLRNFPKAYEYLREMATLPSCDEISLTVIQGILFLIQKQPWQANALFKHAIKLPGADMQTYIEIGEAYYDNGYVREALDFVKPYAETLPEDEVEAGWVFLAACARELHDQSLFLQYLKKACTYYPQGVKRIFKDYFPASLNIDQYYDYAVNHPIDKT
ncbi:MAG: tetratricopeptide repeat protein [Prevotella sp.]